jgi:hypothetical protein
MPNKTPNPMDDRPESSPVGNWAMVPEFSVRNPVSDPGWGSDEGGGTAVTGSVEWNPGYIDPVPDGDGPGGHHGGAAPNGDFSPHYASDTSDFGLGPPMVRGGGHVPGGRSGTHAELWPSGGVASSKTDDPR